MLDMLRLDKTLFCMDVCNDVVEGVLVFRPDHLEALEEIMEDDKAIELPTKITYSPDGVKYVCVYDKASRFRVWVYSFATYIHTTYTIPPPHHHHTPPSPKVALLCGL